jgi:hypothetical protein
MWYNNLMSKTSVKVKLTGTDGNIFFLTRRVTSALKKAGHTDLAYACTSEVFKAGSYAEALGVVADYVEVS